MLLTAFINCSLPPCFPFNLYTFSQLVYIIHLSILNCAIIIIVIIIVVVVVVIIVVVATIVVVAISALW